MKTKFAQLLPLLLLSLLISGCATTYKPGAPIPKLTEIPDFPAGVSISLINAQPAVEKVEISQPGTGYTVYAILHDWTDQAIRALDRTLKKKGVAVGAGSRKSLKIAITKVTLSTAASGWSFRCTVVFTIDTGDGQPFTLGADDTSWKWYNACNGGIQKLVLVALHDERVLKALASP
jgi:hypothetical protein